MLRRLSPQSQQIVKQAQQIARQYEQDYIDGEHLLLAMAQADGNQASDLLKRSGATVQALRTTIEGFFKESHPQETFVVGRLPGTLHFRNVVAKAVEIAEDSKALAVEPQHLLLALSQEKDSLAVRALEGVGLGPDKVQKLLGQGG